VEADREILLVLDYVHGESLAELVKREHGRARRVPPSVALAIAIDALRGLHAAHECTSARGEPLDLVHRDLSPHNILVDIHGTAKIADFGVAKARGRMQTLTKTGELKGKASYMAPEQVHGKVSRRSDVFSMGVVLWEVLSAERLFVGASQGATLGRVLLANVPDLRTKVPEISEDVAQAIAQSLRRRPEDRFTTALDFACALESGGAVASRAEVARWVEDLAGREIDARACEVAELEGGSPLDRRPSRHPWKAQKLFLSLGAVTLVVAALAGWRSRSVTAPTTAASAAPSEERVGADIPPPPDDTEPAPEQAEPSPSIPARRSNGVPPRRLVRRAPKPDCTPPFVIEGGRKLFKPECF
jgi:serine/threonine-protein kinase